MQGLSPHPNIIFYVKGGIGKNIIATVLLKLLRQRYSDSNIVLVCSHPSIFKNNPNKLGYLYILTPKGISAKTRLTIDFMKRKIQELKL